MGWLLSSTFRACATTSAATNRPADHAQPEVSAEIIAKAGRDLGVHRVQEGDVVILAEALRSPTRPR
jgi:hypothetical protein